MWPFKKENPVSPIEDAYQKRLDGIRRLQEKFPIGSMFKYLGIDCIVTHHKEPFTDYVVYDYGAWCPSQMMPIYGFKPHLRADYVDKHGVIRSLSLTYDEAMRLSEKT